MPLDLNILKALKRPPRGFHLYLWLTYRTGRGRAPKLGLVPTGGRWGTITNLRKQIVALVNAKIAFGYTGNENVDVGGHQLFADEWALWWDENKGSIEQGSLFPNYIDIGEKLAEDIAINRPQFSWTRIKGESNVQGGQGNGWVEGGEGNRVGATGVRAETAAAPGGALAPGQRWRRGSGGARVASGMSCCGCCAASHSMRCRVRSGSRSIASRSGRNGPWRRVEDTPGLKLKADIAVAPEPDLFSAGIAVRHAGLAQDRMLVKDFGAVDNGLDEPFFNA